MRRFTVSLSDDAYVALSERAAAGSPPATLQQMVRHAVDLLLNPSAERDTGGRALGPPSEDLLAFRIGGLRFGLPISAVESVSGSVSVWPIPSVDPRVRGVAVHRGRLVEVFDGAASVLDRPAEHDGGRLLAVSDGVLHYLLAVSAVEGLVAVEDLEFWPAPISAGRAVAGMASAGSALLTVLDPSQITSTSS